MKWRELWLTEKKATLRMSVWGSDAKSSRRLMLRWSSMSAVYCFCSNCFFSPGQTNFHVSFAFAAHTHANVKARCVALMHARMHAVSFLMPSTCFMASGQTSTSTLMYQIIDPSKIRMKSRLVI